MESKANKATRRQKVYYTYRSGRTRPMIRLSGKYLQQYGFNAGDTIQFSIGENLIVIKKLEAG